MSMSPRSAFSSRRAVARCPHGLGTVAVSGGRRLVASALIGGALGSALGGCNSSAAPEQSAPSTEPERFHFALPNTDVTVELRGEGSETLRVPVGAHVTRTDTVFGVEAGPDFAVEVVSHAPTLSELSGGAGVAPVFSESDLSVSKSAQGYSFVVVRELVPEWDESERQRFACGSAGGEVRGRSTGAPTRGFSKASIEHMVASCRSLSLPPLE